MAFMQRAQGMSWLFSALFLFINLAGQLGFSALVLLRRRVDVAVAGLVTLLLVQAVAYQMLSDLSFVFRALSVCGGLFMVLSEYWAESTQAGRRLGLPGLPELGRGDRAAYLQMAGRMLLVGLVVALLQGGDGGFTPLRVAAAGAGALLSVLVIVGFKAKTTAMLLLVVLSAANVALNGFWALRASSYQRDQAQYSFFQTLSVVGGFLLLVNLGPGGLSIDERKKRY